MFIMKHTGKKIISLVLAAIMLSALILCFTGCSKNDGPFVYVSVANEKGEIVALYEKLAYTENMTVDNALAALHAEKCKDGYESYESDFGLSMSKLWGVENGGSYGYYVNNASPTSLADTLKENDHVYAYIYTDTQTFSDTYSFFNANTAEIGAGEKLSLTLSCLSYDASWNLATLPVSDAAIEIDGEASAYKTDADGKAEITFDKKGTYVVTASSDTMTLVPAFVIVTVK